jgi:hypothetical protein
VNQLICLFPNDHPKVFHMQVWGKDFQIPNLKYFGNWFLLCNINNKHKCTHVPIHWKMSHHWGIFIGEFLATCNGQMATNQSLHQQASASGCCYS